MPFFVARKTFGKCLALVSHPGSTLKAEVKSGRARIKKQKIDKRTQDPQESKGQEQTIKNHVSNILRKLKANGRAHIVALAIRHGWISAEELPSPPELTE